MNRQKTLEEPTTSAEWEELIDDPNEPEVIVDMEAVAQASADYDAGLIELTPWEQVKAKLHARN